MIRRQLALAAALGAGLVPAPGVSAALPVADASSARPAALESAIADLARARTGLASGSLAEAVRGVAGLARVALPEPAAVAAPATVPTAIAGPLARLAGAVSTARTLAASALRRSPEDLAGLMAAGDEAIRAYDAPLDGSAGGAAADGIERITADVLEAVDRRTLYAAGVEVAAAVDEALPALRAAAAATPAPAGALAGCDIVDQSNLCVAGTGSNTITGDYALVVDLGGDDTHANSAGGAWLGLPVSVAVDVGGNDRYQTPVPTPAGAFAVQGSGVLGVGVLVDAAGNDTYAATGGDVATGMFAQGAGGGAGVGILADLGGNDAYSAAKVRSQGASSPQAQGFGDTAGFGLMLDASGNDTYAVEARSCSECHVDPHAYGYGEIGGVGVSFDGGGADRMSFVGATASVPEDGPAPFPTGSFEVNVWGFGFSLAGSVAAVISGDGPTERTVLGFNGGRASAGVEVRVFGHSDRGPLGAISDLGGDDLYSARAESRIVQRLRVDDSCACEGVEAVAVADQASVIGMGFGQLGGVGVLQDRAGNDRYLSSGTGYAEAVASDDRVETVSDGDAGALAQAAVIYNNFSIVQGAGFTAGAGYLEDRGGDDVYESRAGAEAHATANGASSRTPRQAVVGAPGGWSNAQGYGATGHGGLFDSGGADTFTSVSSAVGTADPPTEVVVGNPVARVQGEGSGLLLDLGAGADTFASTPLNPACTGTKGQGVWIACGNAGGGANV